MGLGLRVTNKHRGGEGVGAVASESFVPSQSRQRDTRDGCEASERKKENNTFWWKILL